MMSSCLHSPEQPAFVSAVASNPCSRCGACCACYRVRFPKEEILLPGGWVPAVLTVKVDLRSRAMRGTEGREKRCTALAGKVGISVRCTIYARRPSTCRNFAAAWESGDGNANCDRARTYFGLPPLGGL